MPTKQELEQLIAESRAKAEQDKLDSAKLAEDNKLLQQQLDEIKAYEEMPPQAPPVNATQLDRIVVVADKINTKVDSKVDIATTRFVTEGAPAVNHPISEAIGTTPGNTIASMAYADWAAAQQLTTALANYLPIPELAKRKYKRADGSVIGFTDINDSGLPQVTAVTQDYVDAKAPNKQLVVVYNDGSTETFKVG